MNRSKLVAYGFATIFTMALFVAITPTASAQAEQQVILSQVGAPIRDESQLVKGRLPPEVAKFSVQFKFSVELPKHGVCPVTPVTVQFTIQEKTPTDYASTSLSASQITKIVDPQAAAATTGFDTTLTVVTTRAAPAFQTAQFSVKAIAKPGSGPSGGCNLKDSLQVEVPTEVINDYVPIMEYAPSKYIQKTGQNKDVIFGITMTNFGNGQTKVGTTVAAVGKKLDALIGPPQTTLESKAESGDKAKNTKDIIVQGRTPHSNGYTNSLYSFSVSFAATAVQTGVDIPEDKQSLTLSVQVQGVYVPGFDPASAIAALGVALVGMGAMRRRM